MMPITEIPLSSRNRVEPDSPRPGTRTTVPDDGSLLNLPAAIPSARGAVLQVGFPFGRKPALVCIMVVAPLLVAECAFRSEFVTKRLPLPSRGLGLSMLDLNVELLKRFAADEAGVDCVFIGDSRVHRGIDPEQFTRHVSRLTGYRFRAFNLTSGGMPQAGKVVLAQLAMRHRPRIIFYGLSCEIAERNEDSLHLNVLRENPWIRHQLGETNPDGWLRDHSRAYQYCLVVRNWMRGFQFFAELRDRKHYEQELTRCGFAPSDKNALKQDPAGSSSRRLPEGVSCFPMLDEVISHCGSARVIFLRMPVHDYSYSKLNTTKKAYLKRFEMIAQKIRSRGAEVWCWDESDIRDEAWKNSGHLNAKGARIFTRRVAETFAAKMVPGEILSASEGNGGALK